MITARRIPVRLALTAGLLAAVVVGGCGKKQVEDAAPVVRPVKTMVVGGIATGELSFPATVEAGEKALLSFRVSGRLVELPVEEGMMAEKGQLIARLDPRDFQIAVEEAQANYTKAASDYRRYQQLYEKNAIPLAELELRRSQRDVAKARLDEARRNFDYTYLRAPFEGRIGRRYVENFMDVRANQEIVDLNNVNTVEIVFDVAENIIKGLRAGWRVDVFALFDAAPGARYPLERKEIATRADPTTQTFEATFVMPQPEEFTLLPGMTAEVRAVITQTEGTLGEQNITIPAIAVMGDPDGDGYVWVVDRASMTVRKQAVTMGSITGTSDLVVRDGLEVGDVIVVAGVTQLQEGMEVRFWKEQE